MENMKTTSSSLSLLNIYRRNYHESKAFINACNKGVIKANKGYWLNQCKRDKQALKAYCVKLRNYLNNR